MGAEMCIRDRYDIQHQEYIGNRPGSGPYLTGSGFLGTQVVKNGCCAAGKFHQNFAPRRVIALPSEFGHG